MRPTCTWSEDEDGVWECSACGAMWVLSDGTPFENKMRYCPECGERITEEKKYKGEDEDE